MLTRVAHRRAILPVLALALAGPAAAEHYDITPVMVENLTPMPGGGVINGMTRAAGSTDAGEILVGGWVWDDPDLDHKVFLMGGSGPGDRVVLEAGEPTPGGGTWSDFEPTVNGAGELAFSGVVDFATFGTWTRKTGGDAEIAIPGDPAAPIPGGTWSDNMAALAISDGGVTLFYARVGTAGGDRDGLFLHGPGGQQLVVLNGDPAPGGGTFAGIDSIAAAQIDDDSLAFQADVSGGATTSGLYRWDAGVITPLVVAGDTVPGPRGGTFDEIRAWPDANPSGAVVFVAWILREGPGAYPALFVHDAGALTEIFYFRDPVPGSAGLSFSTAWYVAINGRGQVAWSGSLNEAPWNGLFFWNGTRTVPVLLEGVPHPPSGLDVYQFGQRVELEDSGRILFDAGSNDLGAYGLFTAMPVEVVPALPAAGRLVLTLALAAAGALGVRRIRR